MFGVNNTSMVLRSIQPVSIVGDVVRFRMFVYLSSKEVFWIWCSCHPELVLHHVSFLNCGRGESLGSATCHRTVVRGRQCMLPVKYFHSNKSSLCSH